MNVTNRGYYTTQYLDRKRGRPYSRNQSFIDPRDDIELEGEEDDNDDDDENDNDDDDNNDDTDTLRLYERSKQNKFNQLNYSKTNQQYYVPSKSPNRLKSLIRQRILQNDMKTDENNFDSKFYAGKPCGQNPGKDKDFGNNANYNDLNLGLSPISPTSSKSTNGYTPFPPIAKQESSDLPELDPQPPTVLTTKISSQSHLQSKKYPRPEINKNSSIKKTSNPDDLIEDIITPAQLIHIQRGEQFDPTPDQFLNFSTGSGVHQPSVPNRKLATIKSKQSSNRGGNKTIVEDSIGFDGYYIKQKQDYDTALDFDFEPKLYTHKTFHDVFNNKSELIDIYNPMEFVFDNKPHGNNLARAFKEIKLKLGKDDYKNYDYYKFNLNQNSQETPNVSDEDGDHTSLNGETNNLDKKKKTSFPRIFQSKSKKKFKQHFDKDFSENFENQSILNGSLEEPLDNKDQSNTSNNSFSKSEIPQYSQSVTELNHIQTSENLESQDLKPLSNQVHNNSNSELDKLAFEEYDKKEKKSSFFGIRLLTSQGKIKTSPISEKYTVSDNTEELIDLKSISSNSQNFENNSISLDIDSNQSSNINSDPQMSYSKTTSSTKGKSSASSNSKKSSTWGKVLNLVAIPDPPPAKSKPNKKKSISGSTWKATVSKWNSPVKPTSSKSSNSKKNKEIVVEADRGSFISKVLYFDPDTKQLAAPADSKSDIVPAAAAFIRAVTNHPWIKAIEPYMKQATPYMKMVTPYASKAAPYAHPTKITGELRNYELFKVLFGPLDGIASRVPALQVFVHTIEVIFFLWIVMEGFKIVSFFMSIFNAITAPFVAVQKTVN